MLCKGFVLGEDEIREILLNNGLDTSLESYILFNNILNQAMLNVRQILSILHSSYDENNKVCSVIVGNLLSKSVSFKDDVLVAAYERGSFLNDDLIYKTVSDVLKNLKINEDRVHVGIFEYVE